MEKTDHSFLKAKIMLRMNHLPEKKAFSVIDAFAGEGLIWDFIKKETGRDIEILKIDKQNDLEGIYLKGDNLKFIQCLPIEEFDIIDLDAYGVCFDLLDWIITYDLEREINHKIFLTFNKLYKGDLPKKMLNRLGYSDAMIRKIRSLFSKDPIGKFKDYLGTIGIKKIYIKQFNKMHTMVSYIFFET